MRVPATDRDRVEADSAAPARTVLAARRSALGGLGVALLALGAASRTAGTWPVVVAAGATCCCAVAAVLLTPVERNRSRHGPSGDGAAATSPWSVLLVAATVPVLLAAVGVALALAG